MIYLSETKFVEDFDGLVGWLSYFGYWYATQGYRVKNLDIVLKSLEEASGVVLNEISHLLKYSPRYRVILRLLQRDIHVGVKYIDFYF